MFATRKLISSPRILQRKLTLRVSSTDQLNEQIMNDTIFPGSTHKAEEIRNFEETRQFGDIVLMCRVLICTFQDTMRSTKLQSYA